MQERYARAVGASLGWTPEPGRFHLLSVDIAHITFIRYDSASEDQHVAMWPPGQQFIRRHTSPTSLGTPQPFRRIIAAG